MLDPFTTSKLMSPPWLAIRPTISLRAHPAFSGVSKTMSSVGGQMSLACRMERRIASGALAVMAPVTVHELPLPALGAKRHDLGRVVVAQIVTDLSLPRVRAGHRHLTPSDTAKLDCVESWHPLTARLASTPVNAGRPCRDK